jgi:hypothetical protein
VLALDLLRGALARLVCIRIAMTRVRAPMVGRIPRDAKWFQQRLKLEKHLIFAAPQDLRQHVATAVIDRVPEPPRLTCLAHVGPHCIDFRVFNALHHHVHLVRPPRVEQPSVHRGERTLFFSRR